MVKLCTTWVLCHEMAHILLGHHDWHISEFNAEIGEVDYQPEDLPQIGLLHWAEVEADVLATNWAIPDEAAIAKMISDATRNLRKTTEFFPSPDTYILHELGTRLQAAVPIMLQSLFHAISGRQPNQWTARHPSPLARRVMIEKHLETVFLPLKAHNAAIYRSRKWDMTESSIYSIFAGHYYSMSANSFQLHDHEVQSLATIRERALNKYALPSTRLRRLHH